MNRNPNDRNSVLMFVVSMLIFGTIGIFRRLIPFSSAFLALVRGVLGGLCLLVFMLVTRRRAGKRPPAGVLLRLVVSGAVMGFNWILLFEAYHYTTVSVATLCYYMEPTIVVLLSPLLFREKLTGRKILCAAVAAFGMVLVSGVIGGAGVGRLKGVLLGLGAAVLYSVVVIINKKISGVDAYLKTVIQLFSSGLVMIPWLLLTGESVGGPAGVPAVLLLLVVGVVHTGVAYVLYFGSMDGLKAQSVAILSYIDPVSALVFSALFLGEPLSPAGAVGAVLIIGSALVSQWGTFSD